YNSGTTYQKNAVVTFCTNNDDPRTCSQYTSLHDGNVGTPPTPNGNNADWQNTPGTPSGEADQQATGGSGGFQSILSPMSSGGSRSDDRIKDQIGANNSSGVQKTLKQKGDANANITQNALGSPNPLPDGTAAAVRGTGSIIAGRDINVLAKESLSINGIS